MTSFPSAFLTLSPTAAQLTVRIHRRPRHNNNNYLSNIPLKQTAFHPRRPPNLQCSNCLANFKCSSEPPQDSSDENEWTFALEALFLEALRTYYQGTPMFSDSEFQTLREELQHLGSAQVRLNDMEKLWIQATSARDFDRRVRDEFGMSDEDLADLKDTLLGSGTVKRPMGTKQVRKVKRRFAGSAGKFALPPGKSFLNDAKKIGADENMEERLKWLLFADASEERFKILLLYFPVVLMSFVSATVLTILFALLDGEMKIIVSNAGRVRLGILSYVVVMLTVWFSNQATPFLLDYLDLGQPNLLRGDCPVCGAPVSCLFTGAARTRDERKCGVCGSIVGFNSRWSKIYLVSPPGSTSFQQPD